MGECLAHIFPFYIWKDNGKNGKYRVRESSGGYLVSTNSFRINQTNLTKKLNKQTIKMKQTHKNEIYRISLPYDDLCEYALSTVCKSMDQLKTIILSSYDGNVITSDHWRFFTWSAHKLDLNIL